MPFTGIPAEGFRFLMEIRFNNNREWFTENKERYLKSLREPLYALASALAPTAQAIDPAIDARPARIVSRIYRDARRCRGGDFYRDVHWLSFKRTGETNSTSDSFYFYLNPEEIGWGMGFFEQRTEAMNAFRARIDANPTLFRSIISDPALGKYKLVGESYSKPKKPDLPEDIALWYNKKTFYTEYTEPVGAAAFSPELLDRLRQAMLDHRRLYHFLNQMEVEQ